MQDHPLLEALHSCLKLPIIILNHDLKLLKAFFHASCQPSLTTDLLDELALLRNRKSLLPFTLLTAPSGLSLALYPFQDYFFLFGPFQLAQNLTKLSSLAQTYPINQKCLDLKIELETYQVIETSHLLHLIHYFFTDEVHSLKTEQAQITNQILLDIRKGLSENLLQDYPSEEEDQGFDFEFELLESIKKGDLQKVRLFLSQDLTPSSYHKNLRSEKNYSIILFEKLSQLAITTGVDYHYAHHSRDYYIDKCEACQKTSEVLLLRESAIILFTQKIGQFNSHSYLISNILHYINQNLSKKLLIETIAKEFNFSESNIRKLFRKEMACSIQQYISRKKIEEAKILLRQQNSVTDISNSLGYSDAAHFSRSFKAMVGMSPKQFQTAPIRDII
ncbi:YSIRK-targeted surface antigen transcriptional regulator [Streptococcus pseudoporcinus LQ 940-04]|uniref:YSIRK-targeted surface antigen transcriptional regulator n=2 Tax=Streptococcus pseudoporcinus TaxID=361101 RepID=G5KAP4_9STRE|nr:transcriptional regulator, AraC family [Streptococcus pseudoporcinus SPIN 20026]EHI64064.1 YSIRK-targeted surface antigen transcriptional regulator [Streptococcus pseudoporcinus LQ 940-04]VEF93125.1 AraC family transcriptional regulator [Streptococcus pseudoporcinus]